MMAKCKNFLTGESCPTFYKVKEPGPVPTGRGISNESWCYVEVLNV